MTVCFHLDGGDLTRIVRSLWADDHQPEKALNVLEGAFPTMTEAQRLAVITGSKKLVGDEYGMELEDDAATETEAGSALSLKGIVACLRKEKEAKENDLRDVVAIATHDITTMGSPDGAVGVPNWRVRDYKAGKIGLDDMCYRDQSEISHRQRPDVHSHSSISEPEPPEAVRPPPPAPHNKIDSDSGWLSPEGMFYPCPYMGHITLAWILDSTEGDLEKQGWVKLSIGWPPFQGKKPATQTQLDKLFDWLGGLPAWAKETP